MTRLRRTLETIEDHLMAVIVVSFIGTGVVGGIGAWIHQMYSANRQAEVEKARIQAGQVIITGDYNENQLLDKYYEISGRKVPIEVDGKPVEEYFKK